MEHLLQQLRIGNAFQIAFFMVGFVVFVKVGSIYNAMYFLNVTVSAYHACPITTSTLNPQIIAERFHTQTLKGTGYKVQNKCSAV